MALLKILLFQLLLLLLISLNINTSLGATLLAYYPLQYNATEVVSGVDGIVTGSDDPFTTGSFRGDGATYIDVPAIPSFSTLSYTIAAWVIVDDASVQNTIFGDWSDLHFFWLMTEATFLEYHVRDIYDIDIAGAYTSANVVSSGVWFHLAVSYNISTGSVAYYVNGVLLQVSPSAQSSSGMRIPQNNGHTYWQIGRKEDSGSNIIGNIQKLQIYSPPLTDDEVAQLAGEVPVNVPTIDVIVIVVRTPLDPSAVDTQSLINAYALRNTIPADHVEVVVRPM